MVRTMLSIRNPYSAFENQGTASLLDKLSVLTGDELSDLTEQLASFGQYIRHDVLRVTNYVRTKFQTAGGVQSLLQTRPRSLIRPGAGVLVAAAVACRDKVRLTLAGDNPVVLRGARGRVFQLSQQQGLWTSRELPSAASLEEVSRDVFAERLAPQRPLSTLIWTPELSRDQWQGVIDHLRQADAPARELIHRALERLGFPPPGTPGTASLQRQPGGHQLTELAHATIRALYALGRKKKGVATHRTAELIYAAYISDDLDGLALLREASILRRLAADQAKRAGATGRRVVSKTTLALVEPCLDLVRFIPSMHACRSDTRSFLLAARLALIALTRHVATQVQYCGELTLRSDEGAALLGLDGLLSSQWKRGKDWLFTVVVENREKKFVRYRACAFLAQRGRDRLLLFDPCQDKRVLAAVRSAMRQFRKLRQRKVLSVISTDAYRDIAGCISPTVLRSCVSLIHAFVLCPDPLRHFRLYPERMIAFGKKVNSRLHAVAERTLYKYATVMRIRRVRAAPVATDDPVAQLKRAGLWDTLSARTLAPKHDSPVKSRLGKLMEASLKVADRLPEEDQTRLMRQYFARSIVLWNRPDPRLKAAARLRILLRLAGRHTEYNEEAWAELMQLRLAPGGELREALQRFADVYGTGMPAWRDVDEIRNTPPMERYDLDAELYATPKDGIVSAIRSLGISLLPRDRDRWEWVGSRVKQAVRSADNVPAAQRAELTRHYLALAVVGWARGWQDDEGLLPLAEASDEEWKALLSSPEPEIKKALQKFRRTFRSLDKPDKDALSDLLGADDMDDEEGEEDDVLDEISESELAQYILPQSEWLSSGAPPSSIGQYAVDGKRLRAAIPVESLALLPALYKRLGGEGTRIPLRFSDDWLGRQLSKDDVLRNALLLMEKHSTPIIRAVTYSDARVKPAELLWHLEGVRVMSGLSGAESWSTVDAIRREEKLGWMGVTSKRVRAWMGTQEEEGTGEDSDTEDSSAEETDNEGSSGALVPIDDGFESDMGDEDD